ncbi:hypothetical protein QYF61_006513 [Mycteria americana]|uniref:Uncharacterized protein n=1 Tax=Mycteria americana TaxID=33587 RepID=A0AAN7PHX5_MYCAM|nr:hypothetical protein QYF61_006513 [Mycteria americana]
MLTREGESQKAFQKIVPELDTLPSLPAPSCSGCLPARGLAALFSAGFQRPGASLAKNPLKSPVKQHPEDVSLGLSSFVVELHNVNQSHEDTLPAAASSPGGVPGCCRLPPPKKKVINKLSKPKVLDAGVKWEDLPTDSAQACMLSLNSREGMGRGGKEKQREGMERGCKEEGKTASRDRQGMAYGIGHIQARDSPYASSLKYRRQQLLLQYLLEKALQYLRDLLYDVDIVGLSASLGYALVAMLIWGCVAWGILAVNVSHSCSMWSDIHHRDDECGAGRGVVSSVLPQGESLQEDICLLEKSWTSLLDPWLLCFFQTCSGFLPPFLQWLEHTGTWRLDKVGEGKAQLPTSTAEIPSPW